ncbi:MAG: CHAP domain-containing protein [Acidimicrobiales bacterium]
MSANAGGHFVRAYVPVTGVVLGACLLLATFGAQLLPSHDAGAAMSPSAHEEPWTGEAGVSASAICSGESPSYACTVAGYAAWLKNPSGWAWNFYGGSEPSHNAYGPHNCTLYVAYRLQAAGLTLSWSANAYDWASAAAANGDVVNQTPSVGSVAQWNTGHVAYVDAVTAHYIVITSDNYQPYDVSTLPGGFTDSFDISRNSPAMADNFIHFNLPVTAEALHLAKRLNPALKR